MGETNRVKASEYIEWTKTGARKVFEMRDHIRIAIGCDSTMLAAGLERLSAALDELKRES